MILGLNIDEEVISTGTSLLNSWEWHVERREDDENWTDMLSDVYAVKTCISGKTNGVLSLLTTNKK